MLRADPRGPEGGQRACVAVPGPRLPLALQSVAAALGALLTMESDR